MLEILYLAWNRLEYTKQSFKLLYRNTNWDLVDRLVIYDDGSVDGTAQYLQKAGRVVPVPAFEFRSVNFNSPPATMNDYLSTTSAELFAKIDNDIALPPRWLDFSLEVIERNPELELLGMEAGRTGPPENARHYGWVPAPHIGGVGLMHTSAFHSRPAIPARGRFGFTEWQKRHKPTLGWISPDLRVIQLDRLPFQPWWLLSEKYIGKGWQRAWPRYDDLTPWWWEWMKQKEMAA